jgi:hypothetical protein
MIYDPWVSKSRDGKTIKAEARISASTLVFVSVDAVTGEALDWSRPHLFPGDNVFAQLVKAARFHVAV